MLSEHAICHHSCLTEFGLPALAFVVCVTFSQSKKWFHLRMRKVNLMSCDSQYVSASPAEETGGWRCKTGSHGTDQSLLTNLLDSFKVLLFIDFYGSPEQPYLQIFFNAVISRSWVSYFMISKLMMTVKYILLSQEKELCYLVIMRYSTRYNEKTKIVSS